VQRGAISPVCDIQKSLVWEIWGKDKQQKSANIISETRKLAHLNRKSKEK
jgi:hypothetical protein